MDVISVRLDNDTEARLKREAQAQGVSLSDFLRERLVGGSQEVTEPDLKKIAEVLDDDLRQICDFLEHSQREQSENAYLLQLMMCEFMLVLMPNGKEKIKNRWNKAIQDAKAHTARQEGKSS